MLSRALLIIHNLPKDIKIKCNGKEFFVNQSVLESSSDYFKCMFNGWKEETTKEIDFTGFHPEAVNMLIHYVECREIPTSEDADVTQSCYRLAQMTLLTELQKSMYDDLKSWAKHPIYAIRILEIVDLDDDIQKICLDSIQDKLIDDGDILIEKKYKFNIISARVKDLILKEILTCAELVE